MTPEKRYTTQQIADKVGVRKETILRWLRAGKIPEPDRDRNNYRIFTEEELKAILRFKNTIRPSPSKTQRSLDLGSANA